MYRTTSVLALGLFLGLAPASYAQYEQQDTEQQTQQQETQQQDTQQQTQQQPDQERSAGLLATEEQSLMVDSMIGANVYSKDDEDESIGSISDVLISVDGEVEGVVIGVGGWLGVGQRDVLVSLEDLSLEAREDDLRLVMQRSREELEAEPEFRRVDEQRQAQTGVQNEVGTMQPGTVQQDTAQQDTAQQDMAQQETGQQDMPEQDVAEQDMPEQDTAEQDMPEQDMPEQDTAEQDMPEQDTAEQDMPEQDVAEQDMPEQDSAQQETVQQKDTAQQETVQQQDTAQQDQQPEQRDGRVVFQDEDSILASTMIGTSVLVGSGEDEEDLGQISDVVITMEGQVEGVVIGVGGFLGIGEKDVIVGMDRLDIQRTEENEVRVTVLETRENLESAESFERPQQQDTQQREQPETEGTE